MRTRQLPHAAFFTAVFVSLAMTTSSLPTPGDAAEAAGDEVASDTGTDTSAQSRTHAAAPSHWAFQPLVKPTLPTVIDDRWPRGAIDRFVLARLEHERLIPAPEADRYTLARRVSLALTGLPPTPEAVDAFVTDENPRAYSKFVDRLLASSAFGERWGRVWLDLARYADSKGYSSDPLRRIWRYRDWVIDAFNRDLGYDEFTREQIAGDLLPKATTEQILATAFHRNTMTNDEGGTDNEEFRVAAVMDRVNTTVQVWMGLTMGCASCHTHKYDPITQRDYYEFFAFFNNTEDADTPDEAPRLRTPTEAQVREFAALEIERQRLDVELSESEFAALEEKWQAAVESQDQSWTILPGVQIDSQSGAQFRELADNSLVTVDGSDENDVYTFEWQGDLEGVTAVRIEALPQEEDDSNVRELGRRRGVFNIEEFQLAYKQPSDEAATLAARYVRLEAKSVNESLALAEVEVYGGAENFARRGKAMQSSTAAGGEARRARDGDTGVVSTSRTEAERNPWWEIALDDERSIDRVVVWIAADDPSAPTGVVELDALTLLVFDSDRRLVRREQLSAEGSTAAASREASPRYVEVDVAGDRQLFLKNITASTDAAGVARTPNARDDRDAERRETGAARTRGWTNARPDDERVQTETATSEPVGEKPSGEPRREIAVLQLREVIDRSATDNDRTKVQSAPATLTLRLVQKRGTLRRVRLAVSRAGGFVHALPHVVRRTLHVPTHERSAAELAVLRSHFAAIVDRFRDLDARRARLDRQIDKARASHPTTPIMRELPEDKRRATRMLVRGNFRSPGDEVQPEVFSAFHPLPKGASANRLGVAEWLLDAENPLTARVTVNRLWSRVFGAGIVVTEEDFGTQGSAPSHPKLLDWLAVGFRDNGWDVKHVLRLMVESATFRQRSHVTRDDVERDPDNRLLSRANSFRLEAEMVRDQALAISGLLSRKIGGPSVYPPQPPGLWRAAFNSRDRKWPTSSGADRYRRGLYTFWRRTIPHPSMATFDAPSREICTLRRSRTNTPLQAFVTLNDPTFVEAAQALARRILLHGTSTDAERAAWGLRLALARPPRQEAIDAVVRLVESEREHFRRQSGAAEKVATDPLGPLPTGVEPAEAAAWTVASSVLLNLDGVLMRR